MPPMVLLRSSLLLLALAAAPAAFLACSDPAPRPPVGDTSGPGFSGAGGGGRDASTTPIVDAGTDGGLVCSSLDLGDTSFVDVQTQPGALPAAQGGVVSGGTWVLVDASQYGASVGGPSGTSLRQKLVFTLNGTNGTFERVEDSGQSTQQRTGSNASGAVEVLPSGNSFTLLPGCPSTRSEVFSYTATATTLILFDARSLASYSFQKR